jgi:hypothetical protein
MLSLLCNRERQESIRRGDHFFVVKCDYTDKDCEETVKKGFLCSER